MIVQCISNDGFECHLTEGEFYVVEPRNNSYRLLDDKGVIRWFGRDKFRIVSEVVAK